MGRPIVAPRACAAHRNPSRVWLAADFASVRLGHLGVLSVGGERQEHGVTIAAGSDLEDDV